MKQYLLYFLIAIFSVFIGSQITEGVLLVPYWQSLSAAEFYSYYNEFGPTIGRFYTVLTIIAAIIPVVLAIYARLTHSKGFGYALISSIFAILFVASFYIYFKDVNESFYQSALTDDEIKIELITWENWHWGRVVAECFSLTFLTFLILSLVKIEKSK